MLWVHEGDAQYENRQASQSAGRHQRPHPALLRFHRPAAPPQVTQSGYRLYDDRALVRLQCILLFRQLQFPLREIKEILDSPAFDHTQALEQQIALLQLQKEHIQKLIDLAREILTIGVNRLDFSAFDTQTLQDYAAQAKALWGSTDAYQEYASKTQGQSPEEQQQAASALMAIFREFGAIRNDARAALPLRLWWQSSGCKSAKAITIVPRKSSGAWAPCTLPAAA